MFKSRYGPYRQTSTIIATTAFFVAAIKNLDQASKQQKATNLTKQALSAGVPFCSDVYNRNETLSDATPLLPAFMSNVNITFPFTRGVTGAWVKIFPNGTGLLSAQGKINNASSLCASERRRTFNMRFFASCLLTGSNDTAAFLNVILRSEVESNCFGLTELSCRRMRFLMTSQTLTYTEKFSAPSATHDKTISWSKCIHSWDENEATVMSKGIVWSS